MAAYGIPEADIARVLGLSDPGSGIVALATSTASGNAGSVTVTAPQITIAPGAEIASTTAGTGAGGSVDVTTPGALVLNGAGDPNTQIASSAIGLLYRLCEILSEELVAGVKGIAMINLDDVDDGIRELRRCQGVRPGGVRVGL